MGTAFFSIAWGSFNAFLVSKVDMDRTDPIQKALDEAKGDMEAAEPLNGDDEDEDDGMPKDA